MKPEDVAVLERRNNMNSELILEKLSNIDTKVDKVEKTVQENYRALRGSNGDAGIVASVDKIEDKMKTVEGINETLHGKGKDDAGLVGEQLQIRKVQKWTMGFGTAILIAVVVQIVTSLIGG